MESGKALCEFNEEMLMTDTELSSGPITPLIRENGDVPFDPNGSGLALVKIPEPLVPVGSNAINGSFSPRTPQDVVFDPFAPGPYDRVWPPECRKLVDELRKSLSFDFSLSVKEDESCVQGDENLSDDMVFELVYANVLEAIVSTHPCFTQRSKVSDGYMTPMLLPRLTGVAETCPDAPMRPMGMPRNFDSGLCRKLEF